MGRCLLLLPGLAATACFYSSPINARPVAEIDNLAPATLHKGDWVTLSARKSFDPDYEPLAFAWQAVSCRSTTDCPDPLASGTETEFSFAVPDKRLVMVGLTVTDPSGARHAAQLALPVSNRAPAIRMQLVDSFATERGEYTVGRLVSFVAGAEAVEGAVDPDGDEVTWSWRVDPPPGSNPDARAFETPSDTTGRLRPDLPGPYTVTASVDDRDGGLDEASVTFYAAADEPPCIVATEPPATVLARYPLSRGGPLRRFAVATALDDLDPFPVATGTADADLGRLAFRWRVVIEGGAERELVGHDLAELTLSGAGYFPGDRLEVRVDISDRVVRATCPDGTPTCSLRGDSCFQRVSWALEVR